jgi:hypothetical protein
MDGETFLLKYLCRFNVHLTKISSMFQFEERNYEGGLKWVCTKSDNDDGMFMKLYEYITGSYVTPFYSNIF